MMRQNLPDQETRREFVRKSLAEFSDVVGWLEGWIEAEISEAFDDLESIGDDALADSLRASLWNALNRPEGIKHAGKASLFLKDKRIFLPVIEAYENSEDILAKYTLWKIREAQRDGLSTPSEIVAYYSDFIGKLASEGNTDFFLKLGVALSKPVQPRSIGEWIARAWLPLALWECGNYLEAYMRCIPIANLLNLPIPLEQFESGFNNTRRRRRNSLIYEKFRT